MTSPSSSSHMSEESQLYMHTFQGKWEEVVKLYETKPELWSAEITSSEDTALHMAINEDKEDIVVRLVDVIIHAKDEDWEEQVEALGKKNEVGETPLHRAAVRGSVTMCECIVEAGNKMKVDLLRITNQWGETPIFKAALHNRKLAFIFLLQAANGAKDELLRSPLNGDTVLHSAIRREHFELAFHIMRHCPDLVSKYNEQGMTPLHILASKPSAFRSGYQLSWWQEIIYFYKYLIELLKKGIQGGIKLTECLLQVVNNISLYLMFFISAQGVRVDPLKYDDSVPPRITDSKGSSKFKCPENYVTCYQFLSSIGGKAEPERDPENQDNYHFKGIVPEDCATCFQFLFMVLQNLFGVLGFGKTFDEIIKARQKHTWSVQILDELMKYAGKTYTIKDGIDPGGLVLGVSHDLPDRLQTFTKTEQEKKGGDENKDKAARKTDTALLVAAQKGVVEVVNRILERLPVSIHDTSSMKKNIVLVAVENRQPRILEALDTKLKVVLQKPNLWQDLLLAVDTDDNTILHLAAKCKLQLQVSSALQMQNEIKWYEYVKSYLPSHYALLANKKGETPGEIFLEHHKVIFEKSDEWLSRTSESCSVVAALVAGVAFATSTTVPGGNHDNTGKPNLEGRPGFDIFAITALIALCFSVTSLIMFLAILTSRKQAADFMRKLPVKLFLALSSLFVSIISMFFSFCAAHSFVLEDNFKKSAVPLYVVISLPLCFTIVEFPLYMDLFKGTFTKYQRPYCRIFRGDGWGCCSSCMIIFIQVILCMHIWLVSIHFCNFQDC